MARKFLLSLTAILLLPWVALASVGQTEGFSMDVFNSVTRCGPVGSAIGKNIVMVGHAQTTYDAWHGTAAHQQEGAVLIQTAKAVGSGGKDIITQSASVNGMQNQPLRFNRFGAWTEGQTLSVDLEMSTLHSGAVGRVTGTQCFVGTQSQTQKTLYGASTSNQFTRVEQVTSVSGGSYSTVKVNNSADVSLSQGHFVSGRP